MNLSPSAVWRMQSLRYGTPEGGLRAFRCTEGHVYLAPHPVCPECTAALLSFADAEKQKEKPIAIEFPMTMTPVELPGFGRLYSWTVIGDPENAPEGFQEFVPYATGLIELDGGVRITGRLADIPRDTKTGVLDRSYLEIGTLFEMVTRIMRKNGDKGIIEYGPLWRPALMEEVRERFPAESLASLIERLSRES